MKTKLTKRQCLLKKAVAHCQIGKDVLDGKMVVPEKFSSVECALFNLLYAVEHIAEVMAENKSEK